MKIEVTDIFCILGKRGSGKSELAKHFLRQMDKNEYPILIMDVNDEYSKDEFENAKIFKTKTLDEYFSTYEEEMQRFIDSNSSGIIVFEDADVLISQSKIPMPIYDLIIRGRHKNMGAMFLFRRANNIHKQVLYNAHHIFIPKLTLPNDLQYLSEYIPATYYILPKLQKYEFFQYEFDTEEQHVVKLNLTTDELEIVDHYGL